MATNVQASVSDVVAAGYVRIGQLADKMLYLLDNYQSAEQEAYAIIDLRQKLEALAFTTDPREVATILGDLGETYGIPDAVYTDPLVRPVLTIPTSGARLEPLVLRIQNGKILRIQGGKALGLGYKLVPTDARPVYATPLMPGQSLGAYAYNGMVGTVLSFTTTAGAAAQPFTAFLWVGGQQVGRVDYPPVAAGNGFSLLYNGTLYYGLFPTVTNQLVNL